jgi:hypothetical protein
MTDESYPAIPDMLTEARVTAANPGKLTVFWLSDDDATPDPPLGVQRVRLPSHSVTVAIDHPDPIGLLADALSEAMHEYGGDDQHASWATLGVLVDHLNAKRASADRGAGATDDEYAERA